MTKKRPAITPVEVEPGMKRVIRSEIRQQRDEQPAHKGIEPDALRSPESQSKEIDATLEETRMEEQLLDDNEGHEGRTPLTTTMDADPSNFDHLVTKLLLEVAEIAHLTQKGTPVNTKSLQKECFPTEVSSVLRDARDLEVHVKDLDNPWTKLRFIVEFFVKYCPQTINLNSLKNNIDEEIMKKLLAVVGEGETGDFMRTLSENVLSLLLQHAFQVLTIIRSEAAGQDHKQEKGSYETKPNEVIQSLADSSTGIAAFDLDQNCHTPSPRSINFSATILPLIDASISTPQVEAVAEPVVCSETDMMELEEKHSSLVETTVSFHPQLSRQPSRPPVEAEVQCSPSPPHSPNSPHSHESGSTEGTLSDDIALPAGPMNTTEAPLQSRKPKQLNISDRLMDAFLKAAHGNTEKNLETCGMLAGSLKKGIFCVTNLIIPKQEATANSCSALNEEEMVKYHEQHNLVQFGWIHTHPAQVCFMSSIDLHTHCSYQMLTPEAVAIVMAPTDCSREYGIFRLVEPSGFNVIKSCQLRGFHVHDNPKDGGSIYEECGHVLLDPKLACTVVDLRVQR